MTAFWLHGWLWAWMFGLGLSLGALWLVIIHHLTGGEWGNSMIPRAQAAAKSVVVLIPLGIPLVMNLPLLFPWADPAQLAADPVLQHRHALFNVPFVSASWLVAMLIWSALAFALSRPETRTLSPEETNTAETGRLPRPQVGLASIGGILHLALTSMLAAQFVMSLEPHFYSSIFGLLFCLGQTLSALSLLIVLCTAEPQPQQRCHDWGAMQLAGTMLTAYLNFSQLVIIWAGNLPEEIEYLLPRVWGAWMPLAIGLFVLYLLGPFLYLLVGPLKRNRKTLRPVAFLQMLLSPAYLYFQIWPSFSPAAMTLDASALSLLIVVAIWAVTYAFFAPRRSA